MANTPIEKVANVFSKMFNPLRSLTKTQIEQMINDGHHGDDVRMQMVFSEIESQSSIYQVCIKKRISGVLNREWDIVPIEDNERAKTQAKTIKDILLKSDRMNEDGLTDAIRHLVMAVFRGRSAIKPFFNQNGDLLFKKLNNWNVLYWNGKFYWNPSSEQVGWLDQGVPLTNVVEIPNGEICQLTDDMPIDLPGLMLYLRQLVGEEQWARFVEKSGIAQVVITAPEGTPATELDVWNFRAKQIYEGGSGTLPAGANVHLLTEARGQDPFTNYVQHQMEMISILATGGTLMTIGGSTGLGSDLARVQKESFNSLVNQDCKRIGNAITNVVLSKICRHLNLGNCLCRFEFVEDDEYSANDYLDMAKKLNDMGIAIDISELKKVTKLSFIDDTEKVWTPTKGDESKEWSPEDKEDLRNEIKSEALR